VKAFTVSIAVGRVVPKYEYEFLVHPNCPDDLMLPKEFYKKGGAIPTNTQFEIELHTWISPRLTGLVHTHKSKDGNHTMMCCPRLIPSLGVALEKILVWAIGTAYTEETRIDFQTIFNGDTLAFLEEMEKTHHIKLASIQPA